MTSRELVYLGWQGFQNFGDDLLYETWSHALQYPPTTCAPLGRDYLRRSGEIVWRRFVSPHTERFILLGGGTTVGFDNWGTHVQRATKAYGARGIYIAGAGVCAGDDTRQVESQPQNWNRWRGINRVVCFGLRGPDSVHEAERHWRRTEVIGDPALLYPSVAPMTRVRHGGGIGVAVGAGGTSSFDLDLLAHVVNETAAELKGQIVLFQLADEDAPQLARFRDLLHRPVRIVRYTGNVATIMTEIAGCSLLISERLHGVVSAVALGVPAISLSYASKCLDFMRSVDATYLAIPPRTSPAELREAVRVATSADVRARIESKTRTLQARLLSVVNEIDAWTGGEVPQPIENRYF